MSAQCTGTIILNQENFNSNTSGAWSSFDVNGNDVWLFANEEASMNGFGGTSSPEEDWLISPALDFSTGVNWMMTFSQTERFSGPDLAVFYSLNYSGSGNPNAATWTILATLEETTSSGTFPAFRSENINLDFLSAANVHVAFKYTATGPGSGEAEHWKVDEICIAGDNSVSSTTCEPVSGDYYACIENFISNGGRCAALKTQLSSLIDNQTVLPYTSSSTYDVWDFMCEYDLVLKDGSTTQFRIWDVFSDNPNGPEPYEYECSDMGGSASDEGQGFNRDHVFPRSWWGGSTSPAQFSDVVNLLPSDIIVNSRKSSFPLGEVDNTTYLSDNGTRIGSSTTDCAPSVFEPIDEYKGDFARIYFYMATRYENQIAGWEGFNVSSEAALTGSKFPVYEPCLLNMLLRWHKDDPVSQKELDRNEGIFIRQNNRNPYVDHPEYVDLIWGLSATGTSITTNCGSVPISNCDFLGDATIIENPVTQATYRVEDNATFNITVPSGDEVLATAGVSITLIAGTHIQQGSQAQFAIEDCTMNSASPLSLEQRNSAYPINTYSPTSSLQLKPYPNPFSTHFQLGFSLPEASPVWIQVFPLNGKAVYQQEAFFDKGTFQLHLDAETWQNGMYYIVLSDGRTRETKLVVKI
ncbi:MAG: endonuclease [Bacteroidota bacterium]